MKSRRSWSRPRKQTRNLADWSVVQSFLSVEDFENSNEFKDMKYVSSSSDQIIFGSDRSSMSHSVRHKFVSCQSFFMFLAQIHFEHIRYQDDSEHSESIKQAESNQTSSKCLLILEMFNSYHVKHVDNHEHRSCFRG